MRALKWLTVQVGIAILSWIFAAIWMALLFRIFEIEDTLVWVVGAIAAVVLPFISFLESLFMLVLRRKNRMGFWDSLFTASVLVVVPFLGGYFYLIGECIECEPVVASLVFAALMFAVPAALIQSTIGRLFIAS